jgi:hypothetical protein
MAPETVKGRPVNFSVYAAILKVLNGDSTVSVRDVAQEAKFYASTAFFVLTTRMGSIYRRCRLVPRNLSEPEKVNRFRQNHELFKVL